MQGLHGPCSRWTAQRDPGLLRANTLFANCDDDTSLQGQSNAPRSESSPAGTPGRSKDAMRNLYSRMPRDAPNEVVSHRILPASSPQLMRVWLPHSSTRNKWPDAKLERAPNTGCSRFAHSHRHTRSVLYAASCETRKPRWRGAHTEDEAARAVQTQIPELPAFFPVYVRVRSWVNARATFSLPRRMAAAAVLQGSRGRGATSTAM